MKKLLKNLFRTSALLLSTVLVFNLCVIDRVNAEEILTDVYDNREEIKSTLNKAIEWLIDSQKDDGSWDNEWIINDTCRSIYSLGTNGYDTSKGLEWLNYITEPSNNDVLAHKLLADSHNESYAAKLIDSVNNDGGYGIKVGYASDPYDTALVIEAFENLGIADYNAHIEKMIDYFVSAQNTDGGWKCNGCNETDYTLSARIAYNILKYLNDNSLNSSKFVSCVEHTESLFSTTSFTDMSEQSIETTLYICLLRNQQGHYSEISDVVKSLSEAQDNNGSFYNNVYYTYLAIKYLNDIEISIDKCDINGVTVDLNKDNIYVNSSEEIIGEYTISYNTVLSKDLQLTTTVYDDEQVVYSQEVPVTLEREKTNVTGLALNYTVDIDSEKVLRVVSVLSDGVEQLKEYVNFIYIQEIPVQPTTEITDLSVILSDHYGYAGTAKTVTSSYRLLYVTNVERILTVKTTVYCGDEVISENKQQAILLPNKTSVENITSEITVNNNSAVTYRFVSEFYDDDRILGTAEDYYCLYEKATVYDTDEDEESENDNSITQFNIFLDSYCVYASAEEEEVTATCQILYNFNSDTDLTVKGFIMDGETELASNEQLIHISNREELAEFELIKIVGLDISQEKTYNFKAEIYDTNGKCIGERNIDFKVKQKPKAELMLAADTKSGADYNVELYWNDISNSEEEYGYHIFRSSDNGESWETRSSWNGEESVNILNIYPRYNAQNYFKNWMNTVVDTETNQTADMGLFNIDTVYIDDYNSNPDKYLKDENGNYKYDVLFFGSSDSNGYKDLSEGSLKGTREFIESGRGVLFGHDTVCLVGTEYHPNFASFADDLGIVVKSKGIFSLSDSVAVVNKGFLTSYPWSITGNLKIPRTHIWGQYSGGNLPGTVWMKLENASVDIDADSGAENTGYLVTNNQLGLIQTGHSNGQATVDECKVIANTLFYLKQTTKCGESIDNSFYDEAPPSMPKAEYILSDYGQNSYSITAKFLSHDFGTKYKYRVEAIPKSDGSENVFSNTIVSEALSDIKGFVVIKTNSENSAIDSIEYEDDGITVANVVMAENGAITYEMSDLNKDEEFYLHVFAIDNAGNISDEYIKKICDNKELLSQQEKVVSSIKTDKSSYHVNDTAYIEITAKIDSYKTFVNGVIEVYDESLNPVDTLSDNCTAEITSYENFEKEFEWNIPDIAAGKYIVSVKWYDESNTLLAEDTAPFSIDINGKVIDTVRTDKLKYNTDETILLSDDIYSNTTNTYVRNLDVKIDILDKVNNETVKEITGSVYLSGRKTVIYNCAVEAVDLGAGSYVVISTVLDGEDVLSSSKSEFTVLEITELTAQYSGKISADDYSDRYKKLSFNVTNNGDENGSNLILRAGIYTSNGELLSVIDKKADIPVGSVVSFTELYNTEPLKIGSYPVVLSILSGDGSEAVLDYCGFEVDSINEYTVTFVDYDGRVIDTQSVKYGEGAVAPESPSRLSDEKYNYTFKGWDKDFSNVTYAITVTAVYDSELIIDENNRYDSDVLDTDTEEKGIDSSDTDVSDIEISDTDVTDTDIDLPNTDTEEKDSDSSDTDVSDIEMSDTDVTDTDIDLPNTDTEEQDRDSSDTDVSDIEISDTDVIDTDIDLPNTDTEEQDSDSSDTDVSDIEISDTDVTDTDIDLPNTDTEEEDSDSSDTDVSDIEISDTDVTDTDIDLPNTDTEEEDSDSSDTDVSDIEISDTDVTDTDIDLPNTDTEEEDSDLSDTDIEVSDTDVTDTDIDLPNTDTEEKDSDSSDTDVSDIEMSDTDITDTDGDLPNTDTEERDSDSSDTDVTDTDKTDSNLPGNNGTDDNKNKTAPVEQVTYDSQVTDVYYPISTVSEVKPNSNITYLSSAVKTGDTKNKVQMLVILISALAAILLLSVKKLSKNKIGEAE